jgi:hypothetical protein
MSRINRYQLICSYCGKEFYNHRAIAKYCSQECYRVDHARKKAICPECGTEFFPKRPRKKFCSRDCANKNQKRKELEPRDLGRLRDKRALEKRIKDRTCQICGFNRFTEFCHIIPNFAGGKYTLDNTLVLCPNHHTLYDHGLLLPEEISRLSEKVQAQYYQWKGSTIRACWENRKDKYCPSLPTLLEPPLEIIDSRGSIFIPISS